MFSLKTVGMATFLESSKKVTGSMTKAMKDSLAKAANHWLSQHKERWIKRVSPEGVSWIKNNPMWAEIKGQSTPLTGITQGTTRTWKGIKFTGNLVHMRSSLQKKVYANRVVFYYPDSVKDRAEATQFGRKGAILIGISATGKERTFTFDIPARPHTGIGPEDANNIEKIFGDGVSEAFK